MLHILDGNPETGATPVDRLAAVEGRLTELCRRRDRTVTVRAARRERSDDGGLVDIDAVTRPVSAAEINRELAALRRMFTLAADDNPQLRAPRMPKLTESTPRQGFFESDQIAAVCRHLPAEVRAVVEFAYITGWLVPSEVQPLEWRNVDFGAGEVRLDAGTTKNGEGRIFPMTAALRELLEA